jgi:hypothetical protein
MSAAGFARVENMTPEERRREICQLLARGILRRRARQLEQPVPSAAPLDLVAETRLSGEVNGAESAPKKRAVAVLLTPRRLSPQHPSSERARHG